MGRKLIVAMLLTLICVVTAAWAAPDNSGIARGAVAAADLLQSAIGLLTRIAGWIPEPLGLVLAGIFVIAFSWLVRRRLSRARR